MIPVIIQNNVNGSCDDAVNWFRLALLLGLMHYIFVFVNFCVGESSMTMSYILEINIGEKMPICMCKHKRVSNHVRHMQKRFYKPHTYKSKYKKVYS